MGFAYSFLSKRLRLRENRDFRISLKNDLNPGRLRIIVSEMSFSSLLNFENRAEVFILQWLKNEGRFLVISPGTEKFRLAI